MSCVRGESILRLETVSPARLQELQRRYPVSYSRPARKFCPDALTASVNAQNQLTGQYAYDAAGDMTNNGSSAYTYNGESQMVSAGGYSYVYDGDGNRVEKTTGGNSPTGTLYWYGAPGIVAETDLAGNMQSEYIFFNGARLARKDGTALPYSVYYYFGNQVSSTAIVADNSGHVQDDSDYYAWGGQVQFSENVANHYWFTSKARDPESGLDYFGARYYGNTFGRFTQPDWSAKAVGVPYANFASPQTLNLYRSAGNAPPINLDLDGHIDCSGSNASGAGCQSIANWNTQHQVSDAAWAVYNFDRATNPTNLLLIPPLARGQTTPSPQRRMQPTLVLPWSQRQDRQNCDLLAFHLSIDSCCLTSRCSTKTEPLLTAEVCQGKWR